MWMHQPSFTLSQTRWRHSCLISPFFSRSAENNFGVEALGCLNFSQQLNAFLLFTWCYIGRTFTELQSDNGFKSASIPPHYSKTALWIGCVQWLLVMDDFGYSLEGIKVWAPSLKNTWKSKCGPDLGQTRWYLAGMAPLVQFEWWNLQNCHFRPRGPALIVIQEFYGHHAPQLSLAEPGPIIPSRTAVIK